MCKINCTVLSSSQVSISPDNQKRYTKDSLSLKTKMNAKFRTQ